MTTATPIKKLASSPVEHTDQSIAVILPAYNEEVTIEATIVDFYQNLPESSIWVINNCSTDQTEVIAWQTLERLQCAGGVIRETSPGKGNAVRRAFLEIDADIYVMADADRTYPAKQVQELILPILNNQADMVVGDRHSAGQYAAENTRRFHSFGNGLVRHLVNHLFRAKLADIMSGYRVFSRFFVKNYPIIVEGFEIETDMTLHALDKRFRILEIPIRYKNRPIGSVSKLNTFRDGIRVLATIANILRHYRPLAFFGTAAFLFCVMGLIAGLPVIIEWLQTQFITRIPLAILATGLELVAIVLMAIALILDSIVGQNRRNFERALLTFKQI